jgi:hypothetical protein
MNYLPGPALNHCPPDLCLRVARITGVSHQRPARIFIKVVPFPLLPCCKWGKEKLRTKSIRNTSQAWPACGQGICMINLPLNQPPLINYLLCSRHLIYMVCPIFSTPLQDCLVTSVQGLENQTWPPSAVPQFHLPKDPNWQCAIWLKHSFTKLSSCKTPSCIYTHRNITQLRKAMKSWHVLHDSWEHYATGMEPGTKGHIW